MLLSDVFPDRRPLMFLNTLVKVSACVADIIRIAQIILEMVCSALMIHVGGFLFSWLDLGTDLSA